MRLNIMDSLIVGAYLIATVIVGLIAGRKIKTMRDFSVASKSFPTTVLVSTIFATWMGGDDLIGVSERVYISGFIFLITACAQTISLFINAYIIAPRIMRDFSDKISISEIMGSLYGKPGQVLCGIATIMFSLGYISVQVKSIGYIGDLFFGIPCIYGTILGSIIIMAYSSVGGIRSVVFTDVLQFGILIVGIPLMASVALDEVGGWDYLISHLPKEHLNIGTSHESFEECVLYIIVLAFPFFSPMIIQRVLMAKDTQQATESLAISGILYIPFYAVITVIALCAVILFPGTNPNDAFLNVLDHSLPPIIKGIAISGALAVIMSTADSFLNIAAVATTNDIIRILWPNKMKDRAELQLSKLVTVLLGILAVFVATKFNRMLDFWLYFSNFWAPVVIGPMLLYMFNFKTNVKVYIYSLIVGTIVMIAYKNNVSESWQTISQLVGAFATAFVMFILDKFQNLSVLSVKHAK